jgi:hypothetical protein
MSSGTPQPEEFQLRRANHGAERARADGTSRPLDHTQGGLRLLITLHQSSASSSRIYDRLFFI